MNSCNFRGFFLISNNSVVTINETSEFINYNGEYRFYFNGNCDAFQNIYIKTYPQIEVNVYLKNDKDVTCEYLGTNNYCIFPNTHIPLSEPFYSYLKPNSYLSINCSLLSKIEIKYEKSLYKPEIKKNIVSAEYNTEYIFKKDEMYKYDHILNIHKPISKKIMYGVSSI